MSDLFGLRALIQDAAPPCRAGDCEARVQRVEQSWTFDKDRGWILKAATVCEEGHRAPVQTLGSGPR